MGQQQILFLILGICILGIATTVGVISLQKDTAHSNREMIVDELYELAAVAQEYYKRPANKNGGGLSFSVMNTEQNGILKLTNHPYNSHAEFSIKRSRFSSHIQIVGIGIERGLDTRHPVRVVMTVWPDKVELDVQN
jgi:hypothetical protein